MSRLDLHDEMLEGVDLDDETSQDCAAERRALRFRGGSREPSAMRLAALRENAHGKWRAEHERLARERRRRGTARGALAASFAIAAAVLLAVLPTEQRPSSQHEQALLLADAWSCGPDFPVGAYCPPGTSSARGAFSSLTDDTLECRLFSPNAASCFF